MAFPKMPTTRRRAAEGLQPPDTDIILPSSCRIRLPPEIMLMIFKYLPSESIVAFSLTCKVFFFKYFSTTEPIPQPLASVPARKIRHKFLTWLEQDVAELAYCHYCDRLHPWKPLNRKRKRTLTSFTHRDYCKARRTENGTAIYVPSEPYNLGPWPTFLLSYYTAYLVMNAVHYGPDHGPSLADLTVHKTTKDIMHRVTQTAKWEPKVIDNDLYIHGHSTFRHMKGSAAGLFDYLLANAQRLTCRHMVVVPIPDPSTGLVREIGDWRPACRGGGHFIFEDLLIPSPHAPRPKTTSITTNTNPPTTAPTRRSPRHPIIFNKQGDPIFRVGRHPIRSCETCWTDFQIEVTATSPCHPETQDEDHLPVPIRRRQRYTEVPKTKYLPMSADPPTNHADTIHVIELTQPQDDDPRDCTITIEQWVRLGPCRNLTEKDTWKSRVHCHGKTRSTMCRLSRAYTTGYGRAGDIARKWYGVDGMEDGDEDMPLSVWRMLKGARFAEILFPKGLAHECIALAN